MHTISERFDAVWPEGWPVPNYVDPPTRGYPNLIIVTLVITTVILALRMYSRYIVTRSPGLDDVFLVAGFIFSIGQSIIEYKALTTWGWNMHLWDVPLTNVEHVRLSAWLIEFFFILGNGCTKISVLLVYRRISDGTNSKWFIRLTWAAMMLTAVYMLALTLELMLVCRPLNAYWKSYNLYYTEKYTCGNERAPIVLSAALSVLSDVYASVLPMLLVRKLRLSTRQRISLFALFSFGFLTAGTGSARFYYLLKVTINYQPGPHTHDATWLGWPIYALTDVEAHLAIICASAPALKALFVQRLKEPLSNVYAASRAMRSRSRSRSRASSSKGIVQESTFSTTVTDASSRRSPDFLHRKQPSVSISEVVLSMSGARDVEAFPMAKIDEKPLPAWPRLKSAADGRFGHQTRVWSGDRDESSSEETSEYWLPIQDASRQYGRKSS